MIRRVSCKYKHGQTVYFVYPDYENNAIHVVRGVVYEIVATMSHRTDIEYGIFYFDQEWQTNCMVHKFWTQTHGTAAGALREVKKLLRNPALKDAKVDTWLKEAKSSPLISEYVGRKNQKSCQA